MLWEIKSSLGHMWDLAHWSLLSGNCGKAEALKTSESSRSSSEALVVLDECILSKSSEGVPLSLLAPRASLFEANWSINNSPVAQAILFGRCAGVR